MCVSFNYHPERGQHDKRGVAIAQRLMSELNALAVEDAANFKASLSTSVNEADPTQVLFDGLIAAVLDGDIGFVQKFRGNVNVVGSFSQDDRLPGDLATRYTALHVAVCVRSSCLSALLIAGADPLVKDSTGLDVISIARIQFLPSDIVATLLRCTECGVVCEESLPRLQGKWLPTREDEWWNAESARDPERFHLWDSDGAGRFGVAGLSGSMCLVARDHDDGVYRIHAYVERPPPPGQYHGSLAMLSEDTYSVEADFLFGGREFYKRASPDTDRAACSKRRRTT